VEHGVSWSNVDKEADKKAGKEADKEAEVFKSG
jgi:hypothetical protein